MKTRLRVNSNILFKGAVCLLSFILLLSAAAPTYAVGGASGRTVRVGYMDHPGFITKNENGRFVGYSAEYMNDICEYTGWQVEYVLAPWPEQLEMLERGEIDIVGIAQYTEERAEKFLFTRQAIGLVQGMLLTLPEGENNIGNTTDSWNGRTIGIVRNSRNTEVLKEFAEKSGFTYTLKEYDYQSDLESALFNKEIDIIAAEQTANGDKVRILDRFASDPYYFITSKSNPQLMDELNDTISKINAYEPSYPTKLYEKYFGSSKTSNRPFFTPVETEYIESCGELTIAYIPDSRPIVYEAEDGTPDGVIPNIMAKVSELSGIKFSYAFVPKDITPLQFLKENPTYIAGGVIASNPAFNNAGVLKTSSFYAPYAALAVHKDRADSFDAATGSYTIGMPKSFQAMHLFIQEHYPNLTIVDYPTPEDGLQAVENKDVDCFAYMYSIMIPHLSNPRYADVVIADSRFMMAPQCSIVMDTKDNSILIGILDKCISMVTEGEMANIESEQLLNSLYHFNQDDVLHRYKFLILYTSMAVLCALTVLITLLFLRQRKYNRDITLHAEYDMTTGVLNRETLQAKSQRYINDNPGSELAILFINIDDMKQINEARGHNAGDETLKAVANVLKDHFRGSAIVGRAGGDEYGVVLSNVASKAILVSSLARLQNTIASLTVGEPMSPISVSIGIAIGIAGKEALDELVHRAEEAMYSVKASGKNGFAFYESKRISMIEAASIDVDMATDVQQSEPSVYNLKSIEEDEDDANMTDCAEYKRLLNTFPNVGVYVIERDTHNVLFYNKRFKELCANVRLGACCRDLQFGPCKNCIVDTMGEQTMAHMIYYSDAFKGEVELTATQFMWKGTTPAVMVSSWPRNLLTSSNSRLPGISNMDSFDYITGALTRAGFIRMIERMQMGGVDLTEYAILFINIKDFKAVNEMVGSKGGDNLLRSVFSRIEHSSLHPVIGSRKESDHFLFMVEKSRVDCSYLPELFNFHWQYGGKDLFIHCRCGIFMIDDNSLEVYKMIDRAKLAKDHIVDDFIQPHAIYEKYMLDEYSDNAEAFLLFENGIKNNEFVVYYQPIINARTGKISSAEALVRRKNPDGKIIAPAKFINILERTGYISMLDNFVAQEVGRFMTERINGGLPIIPISINLSQKDFYDSDFMDWLIERMKVSVLPRGTVMLEITESTYTMNEKKHREYLKELRDLGAIIMLDDFGTGYSSFGMFENYNFDRVKLDMSFVRQLFENANVRQVVASLIPMFHKLGVQVVAEGVETEAELSILREMNCDYIQGYYYSKPLDKAAFIEYIKNNI